MNSVINIDPVISFFKKYWPIVSLVSAKLVLHLLAINHYGYFVDEYYYMASIERPAFGYVDHSPLSIWILSGVTYLFGHSLAVIRMPAVLCGMFVIIITARIAAHLGARIFGQFLAGLAILVAPLILGVNKFYSMNSFEHLFWALALLYIIRLIKENKTFDWVTLGFVLGFGLLNKHSVLFLGFGFFVALLISPQRRYLLTKGPWLTGLIAWLLFLPHVLWQINNDWVTLEFMENARAHKNYFQVGDFLMAQVLEMNPVALPLWLGGLYYFLIHPEGRRFQIPGLIYITLLILFLFTQAKSYYLSPVYSVLFAGGAVFLESAWSENRGRILRFAYAGLLLLAGLILLPLSTPLLSPESYVRYENFLGIKPPKLENHKLGALPQHFAAMFGWERQGRAVWTVYNHLPENIKKDTIIIGSNYGFTGAVEFHAPEKNRADRKLVGGPHNSNYTWGAPVPVSGKQNQGKVILTVGFSRAQLAKYYGNIKEVGRVYCKNCMAYRQVVIIYLCDNPLIPFADIWEKSRKYI